MGLRILKPESYSRYIARNEGALFLLPDGAEKGLILLHGAQESPEIMLQNCPLAALAEELRLALLLPALSNSFGLDWGEGADYRSFLMRELLPWAGENCPAFMLPERCVIGGISMGGFASLSIALSFPETFRGAFSLSGALDLKRSAQFCRICAIPAPKGLSRLAQRPGAALSALLDSSARTKPALYLAWGDEDWFTEENAAFAAEAEDSGYPLTAVRGTGRHNWDYWRESLPEALRWGAYCS